jgi:hypothetical protein
VLVGGASAAGAALLTMTGGQHYQGGTLAVQLLFGLLVLGTTWAAGAAVRERRGTRLFAPHRRYWQSLVPVLTFDDGTLTAARLHPVDLGFGRPVHRRGRPRPAGLTEAEKTLTDAAQLSQPYGTKVGVSDDGTGELLLDEV